MLELSAQGRQIVQDLASRHGVSVEAVQILLEALVAGNGTQAQFNHPDFGGMGQWSQGGMIMIGDMFNNGLKFKVSQLCDELSGLLRHQNVFAPAPAQSQMQSQGGGWQSQGGAGVSFFVPGSGSGSWWPAELGTPSSTGAQNDLLYAWFPTTRRLAIRHGGATRVYDTGDHSIGGFSQQQSGDQSLTFTSQHGLVRVADLPLVPPARGKAPEPAPKTPEHAPKTPEPAPKTAEPPAPAPQPFVPEPPAQMAAHVAPTPGASAPKGPVATDDIFAAIERLADLRQKNILTEEEFSAKKAELLGRL